MLDYNCLTSTFFKSNVSHFEGSNCFICFILDPTLSLVHETINVSKFLVNFGRVKNMRWTQIRFYYILIFCYSKTPHSFRKIHSSSKNLKMSFRMAIWIWTSPLSPVQVFHAPVKKAIKQKEPLRGVLWK